ncbi:hypothetical protein LCGC14_2122050 [marine sediment metagenome]|uniref:DNA circulation N-terminal domain-containing protein n=1 Tax=marine sediment metagenome TaxID=412755 RepID=A0A0F9ER24_9ZZZZ
MALIDTLNAASFKGVKFLARRTSATGGRKTVTHEYPNTDRRFVEDLGKLQKIFTIDGIITGSQNTYAQKRDALITALESEGNGLLVHPFLGQQEVVSTTYSLSEDDSSIGEARFSMTFQKADLNIFPTQSGNNISEINQSLGNVLASSEQDVINDWDVNLSSSPNYDAAQRKLGEVSPAFADAVQRVTKDSAAISTFNAVLSEFDSNINSNIVNSTALATDITSIFNSAAEVASGPDQLLNLFDFLFTFGDDDTVAAPITIDRVQRNLNNTTINNAIQINSLAEGYVGASQIEYETSDQLVLVRESLETQYQKVSAGELSNATREELTTIRNQTRISFENQLVNLPRLIDVTIMTQPITTLTYAFYGDLDRLDTINNLNAFKNPSFVDGDVTITTV